ncbi:MAG: ParB/Srx family N-terminal domain-containing protein [Burkholderiaceae bacterium]|nr:ParB/Srx family N-terminal domain-containing protein [Burkholderiaceae bacterium]
MNAINHTEARALSAAALEAADLGQNLLLVPLSQLILRPSGRNVRKTTPHTSVAELAASIERVGLLQNLIVMPAGDSYEVVAGKRRLLALRLLAQKRRIAKDWEVPCLPVADGTARTASLTENVQREAMHPADQCEAFAALVAEGRSIEDIAADFGITPLVVQRRLRLANVSPRLLADYRAGQATLDQLMALAIVDDHAAQETAYYDAPPYNRSPFALRERLTEREIDAYQHPMARFVGQPAYEAAGGSVRRDLFAEGDTGVYFSDAALLERLARDKLEDMAAPVRGEGWVWVEVLPAITHADLQNFQRAPMERRSPTPRETVHIRKLQARMRTLAEAVDAALEAGDKDKALALQQKVDLLGEQLQALEDGLLAYNDAIKAIAGAIVTIDREGKAVVHRGLLREAGAKALRASRDTADGGKGQKAGQHQVSRMPDRLAQRLSVHRTAALQIELARHPQAALAAVVHGMVQTVLQNTVYSRDMPLNLKLTVKPGLQDLAPDWPESPAAMALRELQQAASQTLPQDSAELFAALLAKSQDELVRLLAICTASTVDVVMPHAVSRYTEQPGVALAQAVGLEMAAWWQPTTEGYFNHVSKATILQEAGEFAPEHVNRLAKLKKDELAGQAQRLAQQAGWMPAVFRTDAAREDTQEAATDAAADAQGSSLDDAAGEAEPAEALTA